MRIKRSDKADRTADGITFGSKTEMDHYFKLKALQRAGEIEKLQHEPTFTFIVNGVEIGKFRPDFAFIDAKTREAHVHEVKGWRRSAKTGKMLPRVDKGFKLRVKLLEACFGLKVEVV